ncbi:epimerase [Arthrobacter sp. JZ12]|uniref:NAD-dependent epimerase/dehydratase family protein n=1 Tax=Arthrobacter sp. JZ12 TaxID=2654190 RepID=UPI002B48F2A9|nr:NAD-dependent epimerase/dehydratase family protein [Arthrobacter sp. JZ12]WRH25873.1 epimerase [Arthrobacter sp. JZ12]
MEEFYVVTGAGPVGWTVAEQLALAGNQVRVLTRSGSGPDLPNIERIRADASDTEQMTRLISRSSAVFHCIHGSSYTHKAWQSELPRAEKVVLEAAGQTDAVVVFPESLYSYSRPDQAMTENSPRAAAGGKRGVRTELLAQRRDSDTPTLSVVAAMITAAGRTDVWNSVLHAPTAAAPTFRTLVKELSRAAGVQDVPVRPIPGWLVRTLGAVPGDMRELAEMLYQFEQPFVMDSSTSEDLLGLRPTPLAEGAAATAAWWREGEPKKPVPATKIVQ